MNDHDVDESSKFQAWLEHMDEALDAFRQILPRDQADQMDYSLKSVDALEAWLLSRYPNFSDAMSQEEATVTGGAARYVGEVLRRHTDSDWGIELADRSRVFFGLPVLSGGRLGPTRECPLSLVTASLDRRTGSYMSRVIAHHARTP